VLRTLLRPDGPTDVQIRSASTSRGSEPTVLVSVNRSSMHEVQCMRHTEGWIIVVTDITLARENIFIVAFQSDRERNPQMPKRQISIHSGLELSILLHISKLFLYLHLCPRYRLSPWYNHPTHTTISRGNSQSQEHQVEQTFSR
jgi:hypothetical protein